VPKPWRRLPPNRDSSVTERIDLPVAGGALATFRLGERRNPPRYALAVHGITATSRAWLAVARELGADATLLAPDLRGRGRSNELPGPYGIGVHADDMLAVLDHFGFARAVLVGHSLGAYILARLAAEHPERVIALVLVDGGLTSPMPPGVDPQALLDASIGPALARLKMTFPDREAYRAWWRRHPALDGSDVDYADLAAYADYDLVGQEPELRSSASQEAVRSDAAELLEMGEAAQHLTIPARHLCAPRGFQDDPNPVQPLELVQKWAAQAPDQRRIEQVPDVNHYTLVMGQRGARAVAAAVREALAPA